MSRSGKSENPDLVRQKLFYEKVFGLTTQFGRFSGFFESTFIKPGRPVIFFNNLSLKEIVGAIKWKNISLWVHDLSIFEEKAEKFVKPNLRLRPSLLFVVAHSQSGKKIVLSQEERTTLDRNFGYSEKLKAGEFVAEHQNILTLKQTLVLFFQDYLANSGDCGQMTAEIKYYLCRPVELAGRKIIPCVYWGELGLTIIFWLPEMAGTEFYCYCASAKSPKN
ncbi:MAG: hypothetical protein WCW02_04865 [Candidatus Buchananbacteria bacterium]